MSSLRSRISRIFSSAFQSLGYDGERYGQVSPSARPDLGQFQCNGAMAVAREQKQNPRAVAERIVAYVRENHQDIFADLSLAGPGFINISLHDTYLAQSAAPLLEDQRLGIPMVSSPHTVLIDFGGPNVAKPMHVGHLRSTIIGDCLQRLIRYLGDEVISDNHLGDWGTQMGMLICELCRRQPDLPYFDPSYTGPYPQDPPVTISQLEEMYPTASKRCKSDEASMREAVRATAELQSGRPGYVALWSHFVSLSVAELKRDFSSLDVQFDHWMGESHYKQRMDRLVAWLRETGKAVMSEGALVMDVAETGDEKEVPPVLLEKSGGGYLYATSDLATIQERIERFRAQEIMYVVDKRQALHFTQVFRAARTAEIASPQIRMVHVGFGTMNGPDGKPFKTREGGVMRLADLVQIVESKAREKMKEAGVAQDLSSEEQDHVARTVGMATLKFADLSNHRESDYVFDVDKFTRFEGRTGPYLLYTAVRIKSILRNAEQQGFRAGPIQPPAEAERGLILLLCSLPDVLSSTRDGLTPNYLCDFAYSLAQEFNRFYRDCHILSESDRKKQASWLSLVSLVLRELELVLGILGIKIPERM